MNWHLVVTAFTDVLDPDLERRSQSIGHYITR
jgi:hypothetical protein